MSTDKLARFWYPPYEVNAKGRLVVDGVPLPPFPTGKGSPPPGTPLVTVRQRYSRLRIEVVFITLNNRRHVTTLPLRDQFRGWQWRPWKVSRVEVPSIEF